MARPLTQYEDDPALSSCSGKEFTQYESGPAAEQPVFTYEHGLQKEARPRALIVIFHAKRAFFRQKERITLDTWNLFQRKFSLTYDIPIKMSLLQ